MPRSSNEVAPIDELEPSDKTRTPSEEETIDKLFEKVGHFGKYQFLAILILAFVATFTSITAYSFVFTTAEPDFRCKIPELDNDTYEIQNAYQQSLVDQYIPLKGGVYDTCSIRLFNQSANASANMSDVVKCDQYVFSKQYYTNTLVTQWRLVCNRESIKSTIVSVYFFGYFGNFIIGLLADAFGRKTTIYGLVILTSICTILWAILVNVTSLSDTTFQVLYSILSFFIGVVCNTFFVGMVLVMELVGPKYRVAAANVFNYFYVVGEFLTLVFGYIFKDYRAFHICLAVYFTVFIFLFWLVPESPRFLLIKGRRQQAAKILTRIARWNKREFNEDDIVDDFNGDGSKPTKSKNNFVKELIKALKIGKFRILLLVSMLNWFVNTFVYNGISFNIGALSGNPYTNYVIGSCVETVAIGTCLFVLEKMKRKIPYSIFLLGAGLCLISIAFVPANLTQVITGLALGGKFFISFTANAFYIITAEIYPTEIRNTIVSFCFAQSNLAAVIAPYVQLLGSLYWFPLPYIIYGAFALIAAVPFIIFVPETKGMQFIDKVEDMNH